MFSLHDPGLCVLMFPQTVNTESFSHGNKDKRNHSRTKGDVRRVRGGEGGTKDEGMTNKKKDNEGEMDVRKRRDGG